MTLREQALEEAKALVKRYNVVYLTFLHKAIERLTLEKMEKQLK